MVAAISLIIFCQVLGAFIGAGATVWGELAYVRALRDGKIDQAEHRHLRAIAHGLRFGMTLLLVASYMLVVAAYLARTPAQPALTPEYWTLMFLAGVTVYVSWALSRKHVSFALGSAILFTTWWFLAYLTTGWMSPLSFGAANAFFIVATAIFYVILQYARMLAHPKTPRA